MYELEFSWQHHACDHYGAYMIITEALYDLDIINEEHAHAEIHITRIYFSR